MFTDTTSKDACIGSQVEVTSTFLIVRSRELNLRLPNRNYARLGIGQSKLGYTKFWRHSGSAGKSRKYCFTILVT